MKTYIAIFSALSLVNLAVTDAQLANIPAKLHRAGERRKWGRRQARRRVAGDDSSAVMSMPNLKQSELDGLATSSAPTLTPSVGTLTGSPVDMTLFPTYSPTAESTILPVTTMIVQTLPPTTESTLLVPMPLVPTYSPMTESTPRPVSTMLDQTLPPKTDSQTQSAPNSKPNDTDRQGDPEGPTTSPAPSVSAAPSANLAPTRSPVSTTLAPSLQPTTESPTQSPLTPVVPTSSPITVPVTSSPSGSPVTTPTTASPTYDPTNAPTVRSTNTPTRKPTHIPTHAPTVTPTIPPTPNPSNKPTFTPTSTPTITPTTMKPTNSSMTTFPTSAPQTNQPTNVPTVTPTTQPIASTPIETIAPTLTPTDSPNAEPTTKTKSPSLSPLYTSVPTLKLTGPVRTTGLKMILTGIGGIPDESEWESTTSSYYAKIYDQNYSPFTYDHMIEVTLTQVASIGSGRKRRLNTRSNTDRALQSDDMSVEVTYTQDMWYRSDDPNIDPTRAFNPLLPLSTGTLRDDYVGELKKLRGYDGLTTVSEIFTSGDGDSGDGGGGGGDGSGNEPKGLATGAIIGIVVGAAAALIILVLGLAHIKKKKGEEEDRNDEIPTVMEFSNAQDMTSASGTAMGSSIPQSYENQTVGTMDYDYAAAFGGMGAGEAASEAGGTLGSRTRQTAADADDMAIVSGVTESGVSIISEDPTFDQVYESDLHEEILDIYAPAGKLGVVIDTPNNGAPVVHAVKDLSPIADKIKVGDKLVAVDDEDTRTMTAIKVSKLLSRKSDNESRKLTVVRLMKND